MKSLLGKVGVILIGLAISGYAEVWGTEDETDYSCNKIRAGMTQDEVLNVLGIPSDKKLESPPAKRPSPDSGTPPYYGRGAVDRWSYNRPGKSPLNIVFFAGKVTSCQDSIKDSGRKGKPGVDIKYDKYKDLTVVSIEMIKIGRPLIGDKSGTRGIQPTIRFSGSYPGQKPAMPNDCKFEYHLMNRNMNYRGCTNDLYCFADGTPVELPPAKRSVRSVIVDHYPGPGDKKGRWGEAYAVEEILIMIPFSSVEKLSKSEKVEFKLCDTESTFTEKEMADLKIFVEAFREK